MGRYKVEVQTDDTGEWHSNGLRFWTEEEALGYAEGLYQRWLLVKRYRVVVVIREGKDIP